MNMLSVKPGRMKAGKDIVVPEATAIVSVVLSTIDTELPAGLKTAVNFRLGEIAIRLG
jgi:hypothetical protein